MDTRRKLHEHFAAASATTNTTSNNVRESSLINLEVKFPITLFFLITSKLTSLSSGIGKAFEARENIKKTAIINN